MAQVTENPSPASWRAVIFWGMLSEAKRLAVRPERYRQFFLAVDAVSPSESDWINCAEFLSQGLGSFCNPGIQSFSPSKLRKLLRARRTGEVGSAIRDLVDEVQPKSVAFQEDGYLSEMLQKWRDAPFDMQTIVNYVALNYGNRRLREVRNAPRAMLAYETKEYLGFIFHKEKKVLVPLHGREGFEALFEPLILNLNLFSRLFLSIFDLPGLDGILFTEAQIAAIHREVCKVLDDQHEDT